MISCSEVCRKCPVVICGEEFFTKFLVVDDNDFDVILSMDWLSKAHAIIDC